MASTRSKLTGSLYITDDLEIVGSITASEGFQGLTDVFSASAQVDHDSTLNFVANDHIDHSGVSITGTGALTGGGTIVTSRAITLDTTSGTFTDGVASALPTGIVSSSAQMDTLFNLDGVVSSSVQVNADTVTNFDSNVKTKLDADGVVSGSIPNSQLANDSVSYVAGDGLTGGGSAALGASATINVVGGDGITANAHDIVVDGTILRKLGDSVITSSAQVNHDATTNFASNEHFTQASITTVGTIGTGAWQGTIIASAYLDSDTAHLTTAQTFTGEKKFATDVTVSGSLIISSSIGDSPYGMLVKGAISASGDVIAYQSSDRNLKDNIVPIESPLEKLSQINGVTFDWNNKQDLYTGRDIGVIAQEIEKVLPEIVQTRETGFKAVRYDKIVALLIEAIKEQQLQIDELKTRL